MPLRYSLALLALLPVSAMAADDFVITNGHQVSIGIAPPPVQPVESYGDNAPSPEPAYGDNAPLRSDEHAIAQPPAQQPRAKQRPVAQVPPGWDSLTDGTAGGGGVLGENGINTMIPAYNRYSQQGRYNHIYYGAPYQDYNTGSDMTNQQERALVGALLNSMTGYVGAASGGSPQNTYIVPHVGEVSNGQPHEGGLPPGWQAP